METYTLRTVIYCLVFIILFQPALPADIVLLPGNVETSLDNAQNGVPVVNISKPSEKGVSQNDFNHYNVRSTGVIINNSVSEVGLSQLGGALGANPNLHGRAANIVLIEVAGTHKTNLEGYQEMFGRPAEFILANPNGIIVNGGGFINTPRVILSTGKAVMLDGVLSKIDVDDGKIVFEGMGLNSNNVDYFQIMTRAAKINANIYAKDLKIIAGRNEIDYETSKIRVKKEGAKMVPEVAIDSTILGGITAGQITLIGTEKGVGVNMEGHMLATTGKTNASLRRAFKLYRYYCQK